MSGMAENKPGQIPGTPREFSDIPYAGLFGDAVIARVLEEIISDPHSLWHPKDLEELTGCSAPRVRDALVTLTRFGLLESSGGKHPAYRVDMNKKTFVALTILAYAVLDDTKESGCMDTAIRHYCETRLNTSTRPCPVPIPAPHPGFPASLPKPGRGKAGVVHEAESGGYTGGRKKSRKTKRAIKVVPAV